MMTLNRTLWLTAGLGTLAAIALVFLWPQPTAQERLAEATIKGDAASGHYPYCSDSSVTKPDLCRNLRQLDPDYIKQSEWQQQSWNLSVDDSNLQITQLQPNRMEAYFNSLAIAPDGQPVAVGGPSLLIARPNSDADTWKVQEFSRFGDALRSIDFNGSKVGMAAGNNGTIMRSQDAGHTWHVYNETYNTDDAAVLQTRIDGEAYAVTFADKDTAVAGGNQRMLRTKDGGQHWRAIAPDIENQAIQEITFITSDKGWAVGTGGTVLRTDDKGATWQSVSLVDQHTMLMGLDFVGEHGCMAGSWQVWCTDDGGDNWIQAKVQLPAGAKANTDYDITRLQLEDEQKGWFVTKSGLIYQTQDGGQTWLPWADITSSEHIQDAEIWGLAITDDTIWAVGSGRFITTHSANTSSLLPSSPLILSWARQN